MKFNAKANPTPSRTTHNTLIEVAWTVIPVVILVVIAIPSFRLLFEQLNIPPADLTIKATGKQWYWTYSYPDDKIEFNSIMLTEAERQKQSPAQPRLLGVDNAIVVPVNKIVRVQTTGADVIHAFAVPSFGIKIDAIPGRLNETWFKATREGVYYGQCSELCGKDHAFMPIAVRVVSEQAYAAWLDGSEEEVAAMDSSAPARSRSRRRKRIAGGNEKTSRNQIMAYDGRRLTTMRTTTRPHADRLAALRLFDQPQGHRHDVPGVRDHRRPHRRRAVDRHAHGAAGAGHADLPGDTTRTCSTCSPPRTA